MIQSDKNSWFTSETDVQRNPLAREYIADYQAGKITRREALKKLAALLGGMAIANSFLAACAPESSASASPKNLRPVPVEASIIKNGMLIDGTGAAPIHDGIVIIVKNKIWAVGHAVDFLISPGTSIIDANGGTIMPGIINAHIHNAESGLVRKVYYLNRGVTSVCDLGSSLSAMSRIKDNTGYGLTARGFCAGPVINVPLGYPGTEELLYPVTTPTEARHAVDDLVNRQADYIKVALEPWNWKLPWRVAERDLIPNLDLVELKAIVEQAHAHDRLVRVHLGTAEMLDFALDGGVDVIEHVPLPRLEDIDFGSKAHDGDYAKLSPAYEAQLARIVKQNVAMVPTLDKIIPWCDGYAVTDERKLLCHQYALAPVHRFHQLGGVIALGDDSYTGLRTWMPVGEMKRLAAAGLTPMEVIQAGTQHAAYVCGHGNELGTLEPGKLADVIVVNGNPLANIDAMNDVSIVMIDGQIAVPAK